MTPFALRFIQKPEREKPASRITAKGKARGSSASAEDRRVLQNLAPTTSGNKGIATQA